MCDIKLNRMTPQVIPILSHVLLCLPAFGRFLWLYHVSNVNMPFPWILRDNWGHTSPPKRGEANHLSGKSVTSCRQCIYTWG